LVPYANIQNFFIYDNNKRPLFFEPKKSGKKFFEKGGALKIGPKNLENNFFEKRVFLNEVKKNSQKKFREHREVLILD
jgi:hypothetical protein